MEIMPDWRVLMVQGAGFLLLLVVFRIFLFSPIMAVLDARRKEIDDRYGDAESQRQVAAELRAEYERHLAGIEEEMRAKITEAVKEGQAVREEILADSRTRAEAILTNAQEQISRERDAAVSELKARMATLAVEAAGKIIDERLDEEKHRELVGKFIDELGGTAK